MLSMPIRSRSRSPDGSAMKHARKWRRNFSVGVRPPRSDFTHFWTWNWRSMRARKPGIHDGPPSESAILTFGYFTSDLHQSRLAAHGSAFQHGRVLATSIGIVAWAGGVMLLDAMWIAIAMSSS